jgi:hypothetical protein
MNSAREGGVMKSLVTKQAKASLVLPLGEALAHLACRDARSAEACTVPVS